ncbi:MAG: hypothetical protein R3B70_42250 [Polyangiaceae bacterium]
MDRRLRVDPAVETVEDIRDEGRRRADAEALGGQIDVELAEEIDLRNDRRAPRHRAPRDDLGVAVRLFQPHRRSDALAGGVRLDFPSRDGHVIHLRVAEIQIGGELRVVVQIVEADLAAEAPRDPSIDERRDRLDREARELHRAGRTPADGPARDQLRGAQIKLGSRAEDLARRAGPCDLQASLRAVVRDRRVEIETVGAASRAPRHELRPAHAHRDVRRAQGAVGFARELDRSTHW